MAEDAPALKEMFDEARFRSVALAMASIEPRFDSARFLEHALPGLDALSLLARLRRMTESLHATLPPGFHDALSLLRQLAPLIDSAFVTLVLPDYVGLYGQAHFEASMEALAFFTCFGSAEFAVREFLRRDLARTLAVMEGWSRSANEHVRRLACEGCRPRLPWSFRLDALVKDPGPTAIILENLKADPSLYVRKSVANHLNDITKDHPEWVLARLAGWELTDARTGWIAKRALRTLIKKGDRRALGLMGAGEKTLIVLSSFEVSPRALQLGGRIAIGARLVSRSPRAQRLVIDYVVHYVKQSGATSEKVFKFKELTLAPGQSVELARSQRIEDFTTRKHHPGRHTVELIVNGERLARDFFELAL